MGPFISEANWKTAEAVVQHMITVSNDANVVRYPLIPALRVVTCKNGASLKLQDTLQSYAAPANDVVT